MYRKHEYNSATYPKEVYTFLDTASGTSGDYEDGDMNEWYSLFGHFGNLMEPQLIPDVFEDTKEELADDVELPIQDLIRFWVHLCSDNSNRIDAQGVRAVRFCLDVFFETILKAIDTESIRRTGEENRRVLVPSIMEGAIPKCDYLQFISNSGLLKAEHIDCLCLFRTHSSCGGTKMGGAANLFEPLFRFPLAIRPKSWISRTGPPL